MVYATLPSFLLTLLSVSSSSLPAAAAAFIVLSIDFIFYRNQCPSLRRTHQPSSRVRVRTWQATLEQLLAAAVATEATAADHQLSMFGLESARKFWASAGKKGLDDNKLFAVAAGSVEHNAIATEFAKTMPHATIDKLERVENGYLHESFQLQAKTLQMQVGGADYNPDAMRYDDAPALPCQRTGSCFSHNHYPSSVLLSTLSLFLATTLQFSALYIYTPEYVDTC